MIVFVLPGCAEYIGNPNSSFFSPTEAVEVSSPFLYAAILACSSAFNFSLSYFSFLSYRSSIRLFSNSLSSSNLSSLVIISSNSSQLKILARFVNFSDSKKSKGSITTFLIELCSSVYSTVSSRSSVTCNISEFLAPCGVFW